MNRIRELREGASVEQVDLHRQLKWKQSHLANYEHGVCTPGLNEIRRTVHALNILGVACSIADVFLEPETGAERLANRSSWAGPSSPGKVTMRTSSPRYRTHDAMLVVIVEGTIARTGMSQDGFTKRLNVELNLRAPERCRAKDYPDLRALGGAATSHAGYARICENRSKRVKHWLDGDVEIPAQVEEPQVQTLEQPQHERALLGLSGRYRLLPVRPVAAEGMGTMKVLGTLMRRLDDAIDVGIRVFDDMILDTRGGQFLPDLINALDSIAAKCTTFSCMAKSVPADEG